MRNRPRMRRRRNFKGLLPPPPPPPPLLRPSSFQPYVECCLNLDRLFYELSSSCMVSRCGWPPYHRWALSRNTILFVLMDVDPFFLHLNHFEMNLDWNLDISVIKRSHQDIILKRLHDGSWPCNMGSGNWNWSTQQSTYAVVSSYATGTVLWSPSLWRWVKHEKWWRNWKEEEDANRNCRDAGDEMMTMIDSNEGGS